MRQVDIEGDQKVVLCSAHFNPEDFKKKQKLNDDAVLSVFSFTKSPTKKRKFYEEKMARETRELVDYSYLCGYILLHVN